MGFLFSNRTSPDNMVTASLSVYQFISLSVVADTVDLLNRVCLVIINGKYMFFVNGWMCLF